MNKKLLAGTALLIPLLYAGVTGYCKNIVVQTYSASFEDGLPSGFSGAGVEVIQTDFAYDGTGVLRVGNARTELNIEPMMVRNRTYRINVRLRGVDPEPAGMGIIRKTSSDSTESIICYQGTESGLTGTEWTELSLVYDNTYTGLETQTLKLFIESQNGIFYVDGVSITEEYESDASGMAYETDIPSLSDTYRQYFKIGNIGSIDAFSDDNEKEWLTRHFDVLGLENGFKLAFLRPDIDTYDFSETDQYVEGALAAGKELHGHVLVWHSRSSSPDWLFKADQSKPLTDGNMIGRDAALQRMHDHISTLVGRYKGKFTSWDVVNEAVSDGWDEDGVCHLRTEYEDTINGEKVNRPYYWHNIIGDDYIEKAFEFAHEADPGAELYYNDYNERNGRKWRAVYNLIKNLREKGIDANIGMQFHIGLTSRITGEPEVWPSWEDWSLEYTIEQFEQLGCKIRISEVDIAGVSDTSSSAETERQLADKYKELFEMLMRHSDSIECVSFWGAADAPDMGVYRNPGIFDSAGRAKRAFWKVITVADGTSFRNDFRLENDRIVLDYTANNITDTAKEYMPVIAQYSRDGQLIDVCFGSGLMPVFNGKTAEKGQLSAERAAGSAVYKAMLWNSPDGMVPLGKSITIDEAE